MLVAASFASNVASFVAGALALAAIQIVRELVVDRQRSKREDERTDARNRREDEHLERSIHRENAAYDRVTRAARRLVADELDTASRDLALMRRKGVWPVATFVEQAAFLSGSEWERNKDRLAEALDDENTWLVTAAFYYSLDRLRELDLTAQPGTQLTTKERESLQSMHDQAIVLSGVLSENVPLPENWREQLRAVREAGDTVGSPMEP